MLRIRKLTKEFRKGDNTIRVLDGLDLDVEKGEFVSVMGPSGSGKSTMLHLVGGLDTPSAGEVWIEDRALSELDDDELTVFRRRRIGFIFQFFNLLPTLSAEENVALPMLLDGKRMKEVRPRVEHLLALVGLTHRRLHKPDELSGGEMQRVAIARALINDPVLILADEPTGNLDSKTGEHIMEIISRGSEERHTTVVLVTHDAHVAAYAPRLVVINDGRIVDDTRRSAAAGRPGLVS